MIKKNYKHNLIKRFNDDIFFFLVKDYFKVQKYKISFIFLYLNWIKYIYLFNFIKHYNHIKGISFLRLWRIFNIFFIKKININYIEFIVRNILQNEENKNILEENDNYLNFLNDKKSFHKKILFKKKSNLSFFFNRKNRLFKRTLYKKKRIYKKWHINFKYKVIKNIKLSLKKIFLIYNFFLNNKDALWKKWKKNLRISLSLKFHNNIFRKYGILNKWKNKNLLKKNNSMKKSKIKNNYFLNFDFDFNKRPRRKFIRRPRTLYGQFLWKRFKVQFFYNLSKKDLKKYCNLSYRKRGNVLSIFILYLESRLDLILFRSNISNSVKESSQLILHKNVLVNDKIITKRNYRVKMNDIISFKNTMFIKKNILKKFSKFNIFFSVPSYLEVNYKTLNIMFINNIIKPEKIPYSFKFTGFDLNSILFYYYN